jgi:hypothetical protein
MSSFRGRGAHALGAYSLATATRSFRSPADFGTDCPLAAVTTYLAEADAQPSNGKQVTRRGNTSVCQIPLGI